MTDYALLVMACVGGLCASVLFVQVCAKIPAGFYFCSPCAVLTVASDAHLDGQLKLHPTQRSQLRLPLEETLGRLLGADEDCEQGARFQNQTPEKHENAKERTSRAMHE